MFDWSDYLSLATELAERDADEARQRSAISRAYYAALCSARNWLRDQEGVTFPPPQSVHFGVWDRLQRSRQAEWREIGELGDRLRRARNRADYKDSLPRLERETRLAVARAERLFVLLRSLQGR